MPRNRDVPPSKRQLRVERTENTAGRRREAIIGTGSKPEARITHAALADPSHPSGAYFMERSERLRSRIVSAVREGQQVGELRSDLIPDEVATDLMALSDGLNLAMAYQSSH